MTESRHAAVPEGLVAALVEGRCGVPFDVLGPHVAHDGGVDVRAFRPDASRVWVEVGGARIEAEPVGEGGMFVARLPQDADTGTPYRLVVEGPGGPRAVQDAYRTPPLADRRRIAAFHGGEERRVHQVLGAHPTRQGDVDGTLFAVWAPAAEAVLLMGDHNGWDARMHPLTRIDGTGVWALFVPGVGVGVRYKYQVVTRGGMRTDRADPCGRAMELRPATASEVWSPEAYAWSDDDWMRARAAWNPDTAPMSAYEVHLGSWKRRPPEERGWGDPGWLGYRALAEELLPYVRDLGFTHVELLPIMEHPLDESWGYQPLGFFAPTSRYGSPDDFRYLVDRAHQLGLGVILDWVPGHFPRDGHGLVRFDGTPLYEDADPRQAVHPDWGTLTFDFARPEVRSFLISSALHWLEDYHVDGLRVDAVASMLYLDYSRPPGTWTPNEYGGRENLHAVAFLRSLNDAVHQEVPGAVTVAEESTSWPGVSHGTDRGGLGFDQKWNMGWMNDTLAVLQSDPIHRKYSYERLTFSMVYAFSERFVLPLSHDEVVHGKRSLLSKMPGDYGDKFRNLRLLLAYMWAHPGKKLLFMGGELGQWTEWAVGGEVDWALGRFEQHEGVRRLVRDLNRLHAGEPALHCFDFRPEGFEWLDCHDRDRTILSFIRWAPEWTDPVLVVANFTPVVRSPFLLAVPFPGRYRVVLNSDAPVYGGEGVPVPEVLEARPSELHGRAWAVELPLPGLAVVFLRHEPQSASSSSSA